MAFRTRILLPLIMGITCSSVNAAGFQLHEVDNGEKALTTGIWYPSERQVPDSANTVYGLSVALDAPVSVGNGALVILSHGFGGWYAGHADTAIALADAGFVVAAPSHTGNTWSDMSSSIDQWMIDRPQHVSRVIDYVSDHPDFADHIDAGKVGVYGFSAGGFTAMSLIGAIPNFDRAQAHCEVDPTEFVCREGMLEGMMAAGMPAFEASAWGADSRVQAAVISAPGFAFTYDAASVENVSVALQLWSGSDDDSVPTESNAANIAALLPNQVETHWIENANHFAFMTVACREEFKQRDPDEYQVVCGDKAGFDRYEFHDQMHGEMIRFFETELLATEK